MSIYGGNWAFVIDGLVNARASTFVAAPIFAGYVSLLNEVATAISGKPLGFLNPLLYQMAQNDPTTFNDFGQGYNNICPQSAQATRLPRAPLRVRDISPPLVGTPSAVSAHRTSRE